jgi:hypothetical protein
VLVNLWASEELRRASNEDRAHEQAVRESGIADLTEGTTVRRHETSRFSLGSS